MAYDTIRDRAVLFGGQELWEWGGSAWSRVAASGGPSNRIGTACAFDEARSQTLIFGGNSGSTRFGDTWAWNGAAWMRVSQTGPSSRTGAAMAYDPIRQRVVLFGGFTTVALGDTWEWNGAAWTQVSATGPSIRGGHAMVYDPSRSRVLLAGGYNLTASNKEFWEWNGESWAQLPAAPGAMETRHSFAMSCDPTGNVLIFGGYSASQGVFLLPNSVWQRSGGVWTQLGQQTTPPARAYARMVWDSRRGRPLLYGGARQDTGGTSPVTMNDLWTLAGSSWTAVPSFGGPSRVSGMVAYDSARDRLISFGGFDQNTYFADTWVLPLSGSTWTRLTPASAPPARSAGLMAFDPLRDRLVLHAGYNGSSFLTDTWEWDGTTWRSVATNGPSTTGSGSMVFDPSRGAILLVSSSGLTWTWSGTVWQPLVTTGTRPPTIGDRLGYDAARDVVVAMSGTPSGTAGVPHTVYELAGTVWTERAIPSGYESRYASASVWNPMTRQMIVFGGYVVRDNIGSVAETWALDYQTPPPTITNQPDGHVFCPGDSIGLTVAAESDVATIYRWRRDGAELADGPTPAGSIISGSGTPTLTITNGRVTDAGVYSCAVGGACGVTLSAGAAVALGSCCLADFNLDGGVDGGDVEAFFLAWEAADPSADMNTDGGVDGGDVEFFFVRWEAGC